MTDFPFDYILFGAVLMLIILLQLAGRLRGPIEFWQGQHDRKKRIAAEKAAEQPNLRSRWIRGDVWALRLEIENRLGEDLTVVSMDCDSGLYAEETEYDEAGNPICRLVPAGPNLSLHWMIRGHSEAFREFSVAPSGEDCPDVFLTVSSSAGTYKSRRLPVPKHAS